MPRWLRNRQTDAARNDTLQALAAAVRASATAAPAGAVDGVGPRDGQVRPEGSSSPAASRAASRGCVELADEPSAHARRPRVRSPATAPADAGPPGKAPPPEERDVERRPAPGRRSDGVDDRGHHVRGRRAEEPKRDVEAVQAHPSGTQRVRLRPHAVDQQPTGIDRRIRQGHGDEQALVALSHPAEARPLPVLGQHPRPRSRSRPPTTSTDLPLSSLSGLEEVLNLDQPMGRTCSSRSIVLLVRYTDSDAQRLEVGAPLVAHPSPPIDRPGRDSR